MDADAKKTALRMIPYGLYVLTAADANGQIATATINWVTQTSFNPPLIVAALKADSGAMAATRASGCFVLNILGKGQQGAAFAFFKPAAVDGDKIAGQPFRKSASGAAILTEAPACLECTVREIVAVGDHYVILAEVVEAHVMKPPAGRPDAAVLEMKDLGEKVFYGG